MPTLQIEFYCLCLFVRDTAGGRAHVVMPATAECHKHEVKLSHMVGESKTELGRMEGLELVLGPATGPGSAHLPSLGDTNDGDVVDLTDVTGDGSGSGGVKAKKVLVQGSPPEIVSRVRLGEGEVIHRKHEARWKFKGEHKRMAYMVWWEIDDVADVLEWNALSGTGTIPLARLSDLGAEQPLPVHGRRGKPKMGYRLRVTHTLPGDDGSGGTMDPHAVKEHFKHFYQALCHPFKEDELPTDPHAPFVGKFNCGAAQVELG